MTKCLWSIQDTYFAHAGTMPSSMILPVLLDFVGTYFPQIPQDRHKGLRVRHGVGWGRAIRRCSMSTPLNRALGLLLYAPKWMRDELLSKNVLRKSKNLIRDPLSTPRRPRHPRPWRKVACHTGSRRT